MRNVEEVRKELIDRCLKQIEDAKEATSQLASDQLYFQGAIAGINSFVEELTSDVKRDEPEQGTQEEATDESE